MSIESFTFGRAVVNGQAHTSDFIIYPDGNVQRSWWRKSGHHLAVEDIQALIDENPQIIVVGSGASGMMRAGSELSRLLGRRNIKLIVEPTAQAVETYNTLSSSKRVGACFHVGC